MLATGCVVEEKWSHLDCAGCLSPTAGLAAGEAVGEEGEEGDDALCCVRLVLPSARGIEGCFFPRE